MFDTLLYAKKLEAVGVSRPQAEAYTQMVAEIIQDKLATRQDMHDLTIATRQEFAALRNEMKQEFAAVRGEMKHEFMSLRGEMQAMKSELKADTEKLEYRLVIKLGSITVLALGAMGAFQLFLLKIVLAH